MGRAPHHSAATLVEHAVSLAAEGGSAAVTMKGLAEAAGASSGSVYHRFASRPHLLGEVWLAALTRFVEDYAAAAADLTEPGDLAVLPLRWARRNRSLARVLLLHSPDDFIGASTPAPLRASIAELQGRSGELLVRLAADLLGGADKASVARVRFALTDVPLAALRRPLRGGGPITRQSEQLVREAATALLDGGTEDD